MSTVAEVRRPRDGRRDEHEPTRYAAVAVKPARDSPRIVCRVSLFTDAKVPAFSRQIL